MEVKGLMIHKDYKVIGRQAGKNTQYLITCKHCSQDEELYGKSFTISRPQLKNLRGEKFCGCKGTYRYSESQNRVLIKRLSEILSFESVVGQEAKASSKMKYRCCCGKSDFSRCTVRAFLKKVGNPCKDCPAGDISSMGKVTSVLQSLEGKGDYYNFTYDNTNKNYRFTCKVCEKDEISEAGLCSGTFSSELGNLRKGSKPCRCGKNHRFTEKQYVYLCQKQSGEGFIVQGCVSDFIGRETKLSYICPKGNQNTCTINNYIRGKRCNCCCTNGFNPDKMGYLYVVKWQTPDTSSFIKMGITNNPVEERVKTQWRKAGRSYSYEILNVYKAVGKKVAEKEREIKRSLPCGVVSKSLFPDGYTETLSIEHLKELISVIEGL